MVESKEQTKKPDDMAGATRHKLTLSSHSGKALVKKDKDFKAMARVFAQPKESRSNHKLAIDVFVTKFQYPNYDEDEQLDTTK